MNVRFGPAEGLRGTLAPPPDKSISHRAALIAAMGSAETAIEGYLDSSDTRSTLDAVRALGASVAVADADIQREVRIRGVGLHGAADADIDVGNAGTLMRLLPGWLAGQGHGAWTLDGDESIRRRPMDRVVDPLVRMGAHVEARDGRLPPLRVEGSTLSGIEYRLPVASAQVKSCLLFAGLLADGETAVSEPVPARDHTERMLRAAGADLSEDDRHGERVVTVRPSVALEPGRIVVPGDFSSAAFFIVAATLVPGSEVRLTGTGLNPTRTGLLGILERMGASVEIAAAAEQAGELTGEVVARHATLAATSVEAAEVPATIDELPLVALLGCFAEGETVVGGAEELRHKESDRIAAVVEGLRGLGADIEARADGFAVRGTGALRGGTLASHGDHRLAMLGAVAGLASREGVEVQGMEAAEVSYPSFVADLMRVTATSA